jgi:hypothetical protein
MKWSISPGLPGVFGARFVLRMWFQMQQPGSNTSSGSTNTNGSSDGARSDTLPVRYLLLPNGSTNSNATFISFDATVGSFLVQPISAAQAIVYINHRPLSDNINQLQDYSFINTSAIGPAISRGGGGNATGPEIVRHAVQANPQMPAFLDNELAWGSPPAARQVGDNPWH